MVVDDSALMRKIISDMINNEEDMEVVAVAKNGEELLEKLEAIKPQVITLDVEMPKMDGITALKEMKKRNLDIPVIMLSSISNQGARQTIDCLEKGAFDFLAKPSGTISLDIEKVKNDLIEKIRAAYDSNYELKKNNENIYKPYIKKITSASKNIKAVAIGASTGGPKALYSIITKLPPDLDVPVFVVQHMPVGFTKAFAERLNKNSKLKVIEAEENQSVENNTVYIAPGGFHMIVTKERKIHLSTEPAIWGVRPAVDKLFFSVANVYGPNLLSVVLTGMGKDGAKGSQYIKEHGGTTFSEDECTCTIYGMPKAAYETGKIDLVLPLYEIAEEIVKVVRSKGR
ncbi:chemotaxis response regulator protein-glutamate methylesterase [Haloimpatiens sp. FM7315]|uniref:protein-glutamate methylesterase/protein-glutamine glutaminase n=1 Tax=Haloimpatiens sp. FM7315 TaxID=3298609 RepID=UPI00370CEEFD